MSKFYLLPVAAALLIAPLTVAQVKASPLVQHGLEAAVAQSIAEPVRAGGGRGGGGGGFRGGAAVRGGGVAVRGGVYRGGGVAVRGGGYRGVGVAGGGRRWYGGRWWSYGVGSCWSPIPGGFVWVCG
jgi:hypothetical protein